MRQFEELECHNGQGDHICQGKSEIGYRFRRQGFVERIWIDDEMRQDFNNLDQLLFKPFRPKIKIYEMCVSFADRSIERGKGWRQCGGWGCDSVVSRLYGEGRG